MSDKTERLNSLDSDKLIDIVRNYRQYGYDENLRNETLKILNKRGIDKEQLILSGNYINENFESVKDIFESFNLNSKKALFFYGLILILFVLNSIILMNKSNFMSIIFLILNLFSIGLFITYLIKSIINQSKFYKAIGKNNDSEYLLIFMILGTPLYFILYFYFRNQMKEQMKMIE